MLPATRTNNKLTSLLLHRKTTRLSNLMNLSVQRYQNNLEKKTNKFPYVFFNTSISPS